SVMRVRPVEGNRVDGLRAAAAPLGDGKGSLDHDHGMLGPFRVRAGHQSGPKGRHVHDAKHGVRPQLMWTLPPLILFWPDARLTMWVPLIITLPSAVRRREDLPQ